MKQDYPIDSVPIERGGYIEFTLTFHWITAWQWQETWHFRERMERRANETIEGIHEYRLLPSFWTKCLSFAPCVCVYHYMTLGTWTMTEYLSAWLDNWTDHAVTQVTTYPRFNRYGFQLTRKQHGAVEQVVIPWWPCFHAEMRCSNWSTRARKSVHFGPEHKSIDISWFKTIVFEYSRLRAVCHCGKFSRIITFYAFYSP